MSLDCNQTKERLEALIDQIVDAGLRGESSEDTQSIQLSSVTLSPDCQEHLNQCSDCRNYQAANRMLIEAAAVLPILEVPHADLLTASIMQAVMDEPIAVNNASSALTSTMPNMATRAIQTKPLGEIYLVAFSFVAFALASAYGVQLDESLWNIASWLIALILFIALRPMIEQQQQKHLEQRNLGTPA